MHDIVGIAFHSGVNTRFSRSFNEKVEVFPAGSDVAECAYIAVNESDTELFEKLQIQFRASPPQVIEGDNFDASSTRLHQLPGQTASDEARTASDQHFHWRLG